MFLYAILSMCSAAFSTGAALFVLLREKNSLVKWSLFLGLVLLGVENLFSGLSFGAASYDELLVWQTWRLAAVALIPGTWLLFTLCYARGARTAFLHTWRIPLTLAFILPISVVVFSGGILFRHTWEGIHAPIVFIEHGMPVNLVHGILIVVAVLAIMNIEHTFRAATGTMRWHIKFMVIGVIIMLSVKIYTSTQALLYSSTDLSLDGLNAVALIVCQGLILRSLLRSHLLSVDLYPPQQILHRSTTAILAGLYLMTVGVMANMATRFGYTQGFPMKSFLLFVTVVGLAVLAISDRVRQTVKRTFSRQFGRPMYNCRKVWTEFTNHTTASTSTSDLAQAVSRMISDTFEILSVTIWLFDESKRKLTFAASTSLAETEARALTGQTEDDSDVIKAIRELDRPLDLARTRGGWADKVRQCNPLRFPDRGEQIICVPLATGEDLLGMMVLADRVRGVPYSSEELDLLKTIGEQVGAKLLNLRLSARLLEAKQMEAFQAMSAFFVHDLKNTSSTLSLMLQNLPKHFENPTFREDALAAIARSVNKINDLILRLTALRKKLDIVPVDTDLNALVRHTITQWSQPRQQEVEQALGKIPSLSIDPDQIQNVLTNLLINADDATSDGGRIYVQTAKRKDWAILSVRDTGRGMSQEFMDESLFRPFRSTKQAGMGIGLFHSKMIVEAHRGRLEAESKQGEGSTFRVLLPVREGS